MVIAIWLLAFLLLLLWSAFAWMTHALLGMLAGAPWEQLLSQLKGISPPEPFGAWWAFTVDLMAPVLQFSLPILQGLLSFAGGALPVILIVIWAIGALILLALAGVATFAAILWHKKRAISKSS
ncbi:hypothetical protein [Variovorax sp. PCZ-1]|uniref:hypothetical protein n=1 Tax=Variovorax sp. PCZ-1 TaxID=2835533 RepID=UPI001BD003DC|nr:hypothetical protein [Variovorax sp. PCZ-1]MBS7808084.1 hypothetical protein [Variovorax sp. PCZ-1]